MGLPELISSVIGILVAVVAYFLKKNIDDFKKIEEVVQTCKIKIEVMETDHTLKHKYLNEKFDLLNQTMKDLTFEIKGLRNEIHQKKNY
jgi:cell division protein FtsB